MNVNESSKYLLKQEIFLGKVLVIRKIVVPLHKSFGDSKNSRTFASAFRARPLGAQRKEFFERLT